MAGNGIELGFAEVLENPMLFAPEHFPSKVGGHPSWLNPVNVPLVPTCTGCSKPMVFLIQIYAGLDRVTNGYHRMIYVFSCKSGSCYKSSSSSPVTVLRSQIAAENPFYGLQPVPEGDINTNKLGVNKSFATGHNGHVNLCCVCGCRAPMKCSRCRQVSYCSKDHQKYDWKEHKSDCNPDLPRSSDHHHLTKSSLLFKELDIAIESEDSNKENLTHENNEELLRKYESKNSEYKISEQDAASLSAEYGTDTDPTFTKFKQRLSHAPDQVLRYKRHDSPLWPTLKGQCPGVPPCGVCGASRTFEFQVLPSLLYELGTGKNEDDLDFGTVVIYTCSGDCEVEQYVEEFGWVQVFDYSGQK